MDICEIKGDKKTLFDKKIMECYGLQQNNQQNNIDWYMWQYIKPASYDLYLHIPKKLTYEIMKEIMGVRDRLILENKNEICQEINDALHIQIPTCLINIIREYYYEKLANLIDWNK